MPFDLSIIDLDNTLYDAGSGVFQRMDRKMTGYIKDKLSISVAEADELRRKYWKQYGTTLRGLMLHHAVDAEDFLHHVHDVNAHELLQHDSLLNASLQQLPGRKLIHTNGTKEHAEHVLTSLGVRHHFFAIYDIRFNAYKPKPCSATLTMLLSRESASATRTLVIDDMPDNLQAARSLGLKTCLVHAANSPEHHHWDYAIPRFHDLLPLLHGQA